MKHNILHSYNKWEQKGAIPVVNKRIVCIVIVRRVGMLYEPIGKLSVHREKTDEGLVMVERRMNKTNKKNRVYHTYIFTKKNEPISSTTNKLPSCYIQWRAFSQAMSTFRKRTKLVVRFERFTSSV